MQCVARDATDLLWYDIEHGVCSVVSANATSLVFAITVDSAVLFSSVPHTKVLLPSEIERLSNIDHYEGKAVAISLHFDGSTHLYVGTVRVRRDGMGELVGQRVSGADGAPPSGEVDCVLEEVANVTGISAVGYGECTFSGDGHVDIMLDEARLFSGAGNVLEPKATHGLSAFKGLNAGTYDKSGDYEVFKISEINATHVSGITYFSTRSATWATDFTAGERVTEACSLFVDAPMNRGPTCDQYQNILAIKDVCLCGMQICGIEP